MRRFVSAGVAAALAVVATFAARGVGAKTSRPFQWSVRLPASVRPHFGAPALAASSDTVATGYDKIRMFRARDGWLRGSCDPLSGEGDWGVWSVANGDFLAYFVPVFRPSVKHASPLFLLSAACTYVNEAELSGLGGRNPLVWQPLVSPSGKTLLLEGWGKKGYQYELRDAGTLGLRRQWSEAESGSPVICAVSDKGYLGLKRILAPGGRTSPGFQNTVWYRTFDGHWKRLPAMADTCSFLSDARFVCVGAVNPAPRRVAASVVAVGDVAGGAPTLRTVKAFWYHVGAFSGILTADEGKYFAVVFDFIGAGPLWGNLDMGPECWRAYIWSAAKLKPVVKFGHWGTPIWPMLALSPDGRWFASVDERKLTVRRLQP